MYKKKSILVLDGKAIKADDSEEENAGDRLERKAKIAENLLLEVEKIKSVYDREKKEKLLRKTTKWLTNYKELNDSDKQKVKEHFPKILTGHKTVNAIIETDNKITVGLNQVFEALEKLMAMPDSKSPKSQNLAQKVAAALNKVQPLIEKVKDKDLLKECKAIQQMLS